MADRNEKPGAAWDYGEIRRAGRESRWNTALDGAARISDDTQMTLFTANGLLFGTTRGCLRGIQGPYPSYFAEAYREWYKTKTSDYPAAVRFQTSWLLNVPARYARRAPGNTCLSALEEGGDGSIEHPINYSKGCGSVMRVAPVGLYFGGSRLAGLAADLMAADVAALTHGHPLGYMPAALLATDRSLWAILWREEARVQGSMTLFFLVTGEALFRQVLDKFFKASRSLYAAHPGPGARRGPGGRVARRGRTGQRRAE